jgi:hypothetical protein
MPSAFDIATYLQTTGHGVLGSSILVGALPDSVDTCIAVYDLGGAAWDRAISMERPMVQVRIRNPAYNNGFAAAYAVAKELHALTDTTINARLYKYVSVTIPPRFETPDRSDRCEFTVTVEIIKEVE